MPYDTSAHRPWLDPAFDRDMREIYERMFCTLADKRPGVSWEMLEDYQYAQVCHHPHTYSMAAYADRFFSPGQRDGLVLARPSYQNLDHPEG